MIHDISRDLNVALRIWRKRPVAAITAVLTVALGAGMNVAVFQVMWAVMLKPLPYPDRDRLMQVWLDNGKEPRTAVPNTLLQQWRERTRAFAQIASYRPWRVTVGGGEPEQVTAALVSAEFFETFGVPLVAGRAFLPVETNEGADNVILLAETYWKRRFAGDTTLVGREIPVDGVLCRVRGIVPEPFFGSIIATKTEPQVYLPISRAQFGGGRRTWTSFAIGRLRPGTTLDQGTLELSGIASESKELDRNRVWLSPLQEEVGHRLRPALLALLGATICVLLIACANLANLLLGLAVTRRRELAVRAALGAGRSRIVRQLVTEAFVLSMAGGAAGLVAGGVLSKAIGALYPGAIPRTGDVGLDWTVYGFAVGVTFATGLLFGLVPAWRASGEANEEALRVGNLWMSRGSRRWADWLVAVQVGLTAVVLLAAGLLLKSLAALGAVDPGFNRDRIVTASVDLPAARFKTREERARFGAAWVERVRSIPGVRAAGISNSLPLRYTTLLELRLRLPGWEGEQGVGTRGVAGDYFEAMGMAWMAGRNFDPKRSEIVVNEAFVRKYLKGRPAVGTLLPQGRNTLTISGVVRDVRHHGLRNEAQPEIFVSFAGFPLNPVDTVVRSALPPAQVAAAIRQELRKLDEALALNRIMTMEEVIGEQLALPRFQAVLVGLFAAVAMALAAVGTYGVISHHVRSRAPEFAVRRALGAETGNLLRLVLVEGLTAPLAGLSVGIIIAGLVSGRYLHTMLYKVETYDAGVMTVTAGLLGATAVLACVLPARWAVRVEPARVLREE
jgi:predicted permease